MSRASSADNAPPSGVTIDRYVLLEELTSATAGPGIRLWRGRDLVLEREVSIRLLDQTDERAAAFAGAARAAALVEDRRLLRVLDVMDVPAFTDVPASIGVVSEWAKGQTLAQVLDERPGQPFTVSDAVIVVADVARAISAGLATNVNHGRLRPSSVIITDAGEVRVRGLAVDAALWGTLTDGLDRTRADVDGLGSLLYLCLTGMWPGGPDLGAPPAPRVGSVVLPPSRIRADVPKSMDELVARSVVDAARPRGMANILDAKAFYAALGVARDYVVPVGRPAERTGLPVPAGMPKRILAVGVGGALVVAGLALGWRLIGNGPSAWSLDPSAETDVLLTAPTVAISAEPLPVGERVHPVLAIRSFDPLADDNGNGKPDRGKGRENEDEVANLTDTDPSTVWTTGTYRSPDLGGKGGVGLVLDLGSTVPVRAVSLDFGDSGAGVEVRVSDDLEVDPQRWTLLATAPPGAPKIELRSPRPVSGRYVLVWLTELPPVPGNADQFQGALRSISVAG